MASVRKEILTIQSSPPPHWVGDGFPVRGAFGDRAFTPEIAGSNPADSANSPHPGRAAG